MTQRFFFFAYRTGRGVSAVVAITLISLMLAACAPLGPRPSATENIFVLNAPFRQEMAQADGPEHNPGEDSRPTIMVTPPRAVPGFDTPRIAYMPRANELSYYANSRWADTPSRMIEPLLIRALEATGEFHAVVPLSSPVLGGLRLDTDILRLQQEFLSRPSRLRLTLRAQVFDLRQRSVLATRTFEAEEETPSDNAYGGATAADRALEKVLREVAAFAAEQASAVGGK